MRVLFFVLFVCIASSYASADTCKVNTAEEILAALPKISQYVTQLMSEKRVPGLSLIFFKGKEILFEKAYGDGVTHPLFQAASVSKPVAAFGALKSAEQGIVALDKPMSDYLKTPYLPPQPFVELVTLRTLLNHTSGLSNDVTGEDRHLYSKPGEKFSYSGGGFLYMQQALEDASMKKFEALMRPTLDSLGMRQSTYELDYEAEHYVSAAFSLLSTPRELASFMMELAEPRPENLWAARTLATPSIDVDPQTKWGLGIRVFKCGDETALHHTGRNFSYHHSVVVVFDRSQVGAVVMARGEDSRGVPSIIANMALDGGLDSRIR